MVNLSAPELAYLRGGSRRALRAALATLAVHGVVRVRADGRLVRSARPPEGAEPYERAVYVNLLGAVYAKDLHGNRRVIEAAAHLRRTLVVGGFLRPWWRRIVVPVVVFGLPIYLLVRTQAVNGPAGVLLALLIALVAACFLPRRTFTGMRTTKALVRWHADLAPQGDPGRADLPDQDPEDVAYAVALFDRAALGERLPRFAAAAGLLGGGKSERFRQPSNTSITYSGGLGETP